MPHIGNNVSNSFQKNFQKKKKMPNLNANQSKAQDQQNQLRHIVTFKLGLSK